MVSVKKVKVSGRGIFVCGWVKNIFVSFNHEEKQKDMNDVISVIKWVVIDFLHILSLGLTRIISMK